MSRRKQVLITLASWTQGTSGGDTHALQMASEWTRTCEVHIIAPEGAKEIVKSLAPAATLHSFVGGSQPTSALLQSIDYLKRLRPIRKLVGSLPAFDIAIAGSHFLPDQAALSKARARKKAGYVYHVSKLQARGFSVRSILAVAAERLSLHLLRKSLDLTFICNDELGKALRGWPTVVRTKVGFDRQSWPLTSSDVRPIDLVFCGRLVETKGVRDFIEVAKYLVEQNLASRVVIIGSGPEEENIRAAIQENGLNNNVTLVGFVEEEEKRNLLLSSKMMVFPSYEEGWGIAVCEALAAGCLVVAYDLPVYRELFGDIVQVASLHDRDALKQVARRVLTSEHQLRRLRAEGREVVDNYDFRLVAQEELRELLTIGGE